MDMKKAALAVALGTLALMSFAGPGEAAERRAAPVASTQAGFQPTKARYARRYGVPVRAYRGRRVGFYSYSYRDVINTYGMSRARYGIINSYRDPFVDMQTPNGPFDHGFFFDSGMLPRGGNAPYLH
jgi:hypothetical protein